MTDLRTVALFDLVVVKDEPALGVARLVEVIRDASGDQARLLLYRDGTVVWRPLAVVVACPPGTAVAPDDPV